MPCIIYESVNVCVSDCSYVWVFVRKTASQSLDQSVINTVSNFIQSVNVYEGVPDGASLWLSVHTTRPHGQLYRYITVGTTS